ncbi:LOW QUALITY PROTEIN: hypothetical protein PAHAL_1G269000 [Panicum hallii]|uniref:Uncharacterized protein n=1 Tax=Panicum hallii TaxID=206008 RepID=A0A2T8KWL7_9POAL|nr:LOW QUALITY PROTEIN: hypothetical protein PAHAL_1G269000 [Panicum hallii]
MPCLSSPKQAPPPLQSHLPLLRRMEHRATAVEATHATQRGSAGESPLPRRAVPRDPLSELLSSSKNGRRLNPADRTPPLPPPQRLQLDGAPRAAPHPSRQQGSRAPRVARPHSHATLSPRIHLSNSSKNGLHLNPATETPPPPPSRRQQQRLRRTPQVAPPPSRKRGSQAPRAASPHSRAAPSLPRLTISLPRPMRCW